MYQHYIKRLLDILISIVLLPFILIIIFLFAIIIKFDDKGKVFYNSYRMGKDGVPFKMYKLRSMKENSPNLLNPDGSCYNSDNDARLTSIGGFLRKTSLDELPQLFNVIKGDMSLIGPRPDLYMYEYEELPQIEKDRLVVRPGITGYNQAFFRNSVCMDNKYSHDIYYIKNISFSLDIKVLLYTVISIFKHDNIYNEASHEN